LAFVCTRGPVVIDHLDIDVNKKAIIVNGDWIAEGATGCLLFLFVRVV
jgi:hypothetical protein